MRSTNLALGSALVHQTKQLRPTKTKRIKHKQKAKRAAGIDGQVATMLESHTREIDKIDTAAMKREWVKCVTRTRIRVRVTRQQNTCSSKICALKAFNCLDKRLSSSNKLRKYAD